MKTLSLLIGLTLFIGCASRGIPLVEYNGPELNSSKDFSVSVTARSMLAVRAPRNEKVLLNLYEPDGSLGITLYKGKVHYGGMIVSLAIIVQKHDYRFKPGKNILQLYGESGKASFELNVTELNGQ